MKNPSPSFRQSQRAEPLRRARPPSRSYTPRRTCPVRAPSRHLPIRSRPPLDPFLPTSKANSHSSRFAFVHFHEELLSSAAHAPAHVAIDEGVKCGDFLITALVR